MRLLLYNNRARAILRLDQDEHNGPYEGSRGWDAASARML